MGSSSRLWRPFCLLTCLPRAAASLLPEEAEEHCVDRAAAPGEEACPEAARHTSLLQRRHEVISPRAAERTGAGPAPRRPNIVLFLPDDMYLRNYAAWLPNDVAPPVPNRFPVREMPLSNAGVMPRLEGIAQSGATFTRAYTSSSSCAPSRYSIMTGRYPSESQVGRDRWRDYFPNVSAAFVGSASLLGQGYSDRENTVASALRNHGYTTGMVGKWGLATLLNANFNDPYTKQTDFVKESGFDFVDGLYIGNMCECFFAVCETFSHNMEWLLERALHFMDDAMRRELPFFLYFAATPAHLPTVQDALLGVYTPYQTPAGPLERYPNISRYCSSCTLASREDVWDSVAGFSSTSEAGSCRASLAALRWLDESLGVLYDFLSERAAIGNTYIVMSTDHGSAKHSLYDTGIRVPLYAVGPGIRAGTRVDEVVSHIDLAPTFLTWAGCCADGPVPIPTDGLSWSSLASAGAGSLDREGVRAESFFDRATVTRDLMKFYSSATSTIISQEIASVDASDNITAKKTLIFKLSHAANNLAHFAGTGYPALYERYQLYNLTADPMEQKNVYSVQRDASIFGKTLDNDVLPPTAV